MASAREIAEKSGVSVTTVSRVLNRHPDVSLATRERVMKAVDRAGYRGPNGRRIGVSVGLVITGDARMWEYDWQLLEGIRVGLNDCKLDLQIINLQRDKRERETYTQFFMRRGLRGVILRTFTQYRGICEAIIAEGFPSIVVAERFEGTDINYICCDSTDESRLAIEHLIQLGHRRVALAIHRRADRDHMDRRSGYETALKSNDIALDHALIAQVVPNLEGGVNAFNQMMSLREPPTAIYFTDPLASIGAMCRAQEVGLKVPEQLSIIGFDDGDIRHRIYPLLTAVCQDTHELGAEAAIYLEKIISGTTQTPVQRTLRASLEINSTTAAPPQGVVRIQPDGTFMN